MVIALLTESWLKLKVFIGWAVICMHMSGLDMLNSEGSSPCDVWWCVLCIPLYLCPPRRW